MKNSESPNKQFAIAARARVVVRRMHSQDRVVSAFQCGNTRVQRCNSPDVSENRMAQGFLGRRLLHARREPCVAIAIARSLDLIASRKRRRDFHRLNFFRRMRSLSSAKGALANKMRESPAK